MKNILKASAVAIAVSMISACSNSNGEVVLTPPKPVGAAAQYVQIERLSRPAIKEVFEPFQDHQKSNAVEPYADSTIQADIAGTEDYVRPANASLGSDYGAFLAKVVYPDEYTVNLEGPSPTAGMADPYFFLSEVADGSTYFGGRAPNDNVIDLELGILFGHTLSALGAQPEDKEEDDCISSQNIASEDPSKLTTATFPYLPVQH